MRTPKVLSRIEVLLTVAAILACFPAAAAAEEATGKVVFVDGGNSALLIEAPKGGGGIPGNEGGAAKEGETYPFLIPTELQGAAKALAPGDLVSFTFEEKEGKQGPRTLKSITKK